MTVDDRLVSGASSPNPNKSSGDIGERLVSRADFFLAEEAMIASDLGVDVEKAGVVSGYRNSDALLDKESAAEIERLRRDNEQLNFTFDLQWEADQRAIKAWQAAHPGKDRTWPDRCCMVIWLIEELATAESAVAAAWDRAIGIVDGADLISHDPGECRQEFLRLLRSARSAQ